MHEMEKTGRPGPGGHRTGRIHLGPTLFFSCCIQTVADCFGTVYTRRTGSDHFFLHGPLPHCHCCLHMHAASAARGCVGYLLVTAYCSAPVIIKPPGTCGEQSLKFKLKKKKLQSLFRRKKKSDFGKKKDEQVQYKSVYL